MLDWIILEMILDQIRFENTGLYQIILDWIILDQIILHWIRLY